MINSQTPYKLAEIIRITWPGFYFYESQKTQKRTELKERTKNNL